MRKIAYEPPRLIRVSPEHISMTAAFSGAGNLFAERPRQSGSSARPQAQGLDSHR